MFGAFGALNPALINENGYTRISPDDVGAYLDSIRTMKVLEAVKAPSYPPVASVDFSLVPGSRDGMPAGDFITQSLANGYWILVPTTLDATAAIPTQRIIAAHPGVETGRVGRAQGGQGSFNDWLKQAASGVSPYGAAMTVLVSPSPGSVVTPVAPVAPAPADTQKAGMTTTTWLVIGVAALGVAWMVWPKKSYTGNRRRSRR
jgi:hypothetical protein